MNRDSITLVGLQDADRIEGVGIHGNRDMQASIAAEKEQHLPIGVNSR
jgi:hypothetical protein